MPQISPGIFPFPCKLLIKSGESSPGMDSANKQNVNQCFNICCRVVNIFTWIFGHSTVTVCDCLWNFNNIPDCLLCNKYVNCPIRFQCTNILNPLCWLYFIFKLAMKAIQMHCCALCCYFNVINNLVRTSVLEIIEQIVYCSWRACFPAPFLILAVAPCC